MRFVARRLRYGRTARKAYKLVDLKDSGKDRSWELGALERIMVIGRFAVFIVKLERFGCVRETNLELGVQWVPPATAGDLLCR